MKYYILATIIYLIIGISIAFFEPKINPIKIDKNIQSFIADRDKCINDYIHQKYPETSEINIGNMMVSGNQCIIYTDKCVLSEFEYEAIQKKCGDK